MTISQGSIKNTVLRYHRQYYRYLKLSVRAAGSCKCEIVEGVSVCVVPLHRFAGGFDEVSKVESAGID